MNHNEEVPDFLGEFLRPDGSKRPEVERTDFSGTQIEDFYNSHRS